MSIKMHFSMRYQNTQHFYDTQIIFKLLACLTPGFQGHEQRRRLVEMKNNSNSGHIRTCVRDDYLDHMLDPCFVHRSQPAVDAVKILTKQGKQFSPFEVASCMIEPKMFGALMHMATK